MTGEVDLLSALFCICSFRLICSARSQHLYHFAICSQLPLPCNGAVFPLYLGTWRREAADRVHETRTQRVHPAT